MIAEYLKYGAIWTKVLSLYGKRLKDTDYANLCQKISVTQVAEYLKNHPYWRGALKDFDLSDVHRGQLEAALKKAALDEYLRVARFCMQGDFKVLNYPIIQAELKEIINFLQLLRANTPELYICELSDYYKQRSKIDFDRFSAARNMDEFLAAVADSEYYMVLKNVNPSEESSYASIEVVLRAHLYSKLVRAINSKYSGDVKKALLKSFGMQIDLINIINVMRIKRYFAYDTEEIQSFIIPNYYKISLDFLKRLAQAQGEAAELVLFEQTIYGNLFKENQFAYLENYLYKALYDFSHKALSTGKPSVFVPIAYLSLKDIELKNVINVIECIRYGIEKERINSFLIL